MFSDLSLIQPTDAKEAVGELKHLGDGAKIYAGGAELLLLMRHELLQVRYLIDIKGIASLGSVFWDGECVRIGATATHRQLEKDPVVRAKLPTLAYAESQVANVRVRQHGTLGGNLCFNDPHSDPATVLLLHEAELAIAGPAGTRRMPLEEFLKGEYETALGPDELVLEVRVPPLPAGWRGSYHRVHRQQRPSLGVGVAAKADGDRLSGVKLAVGCIGPTARRLFELERSIEGGDYRDAARAVDASEGYLREVLEAVDDLLGSAEYKIYMTRVLLRRGLAEAVSENGRISHEP